MNSSKFLLFTLIIFSLIFTQGCSFGFNKNKNNQNTTSGNTTVKKEKPVDYVKEISKDENSINECYIYKERVLKEIEEYKERVSRISDNKEEFKLIGIFKSKSLDKCFYVLENSYISNDKKVVDYIINNAQIEETIDIFNNIDYKFLNERIGELQK